MGDIWVDPEGKAWEAQFAPDGTYLPDMGWWGKRREDLDVPKVAPPPAPPDLTDEVVLKARAQMVRRLLGSQGIGSTFLTGAMGLSGFAPTATPGLAGG